MSGTTRFQQLAATHRDAEWRLRQSVRRRANRIDVEGRIRWRCPECRVVLTGRWWVATDHAAFYHKSWGLAFSEVVSARAERVEREQLRQAVQKQEEERARKHAAWVEERGAYHAALAKQPVDVVWLPPNYRGGVHR